jgi:hypothetical protein
MPLLTCTAKPFVSSAFVDEVAEACLVSAEAFIVVVDVALIGLLHGSHLS